MSGQAGVQPLRLPCGQPRVRGARARGRDPGCGGQSGRRGELNPQRVDPRGCVLREHLARGEEDRVHAPHPPAGVRSAVMARARTLVLAAAMLSGALALAPAAGAATCADYSNQADAQRAADTRDGDGDGVYCEALPCPCSGRSGGGEAPALAPKPRRRVQRISARITTVVDGDTIRVRAFGARRDAYTVRLIGIDTPETQAARATRGVRRAARDRGAVAPVVPRGERLRRRRARGRGTSRGAAGG